MPFTNLRTGRKSGIGPSGVSLTSSDVVATNGVNIYSDVANTDTIWIGPSGFTVDSADLTDGYPISSGDAIFIPARHTGDIFIRSRADSAQKVWWIVQ